MSETDGAPRDLIQTLEVAAEILRALEMEAGPVALAPLARRLGMTPPRIHRHLATLVALGFVERIGTEPVYALGWRLAQLGDRAVRQHDIVQLAHPFMAELREKVGHAVALARRIHDVPTVWLCLESRSTPFVSLAPGTILSPSATASGRVLLAYMDRAARKRALRARLVDPAEPDPIDPATLETRLELIRKRGYEEQGVRGHVAVFGYAAPIFDYQRTVVATLTLMGVTEGRVATFVDPSADLVAAAARISQALGAPPLTEG